MTELRGFENISCYEEITVNQKDLEMVYNVLRLQVFHLETKSFQDIF